MSTINDLNKSPEEMTDEELRELLRRHRLSRRTPKITPRKKKTPKQAKEKSTKEILIGLTEAQKNALLLKLEDEL